METKTVLTNEKLKEKSRSLFDLVNYAILLADNMIKSGRGSRVRIDSDNPAVQIIEEIVQGKDEFVEIVVEEAEVPYPVTKEQEEISVKNVERKKRRLL